MSFRNEEPFSLIAGDNQLEDREIPQIDKYEIGLLPIVAFYGGNASGKSNFVDALEFAQQMVIDGVGVDQPIPIIPFLLNTGSEQKPSKFKIELLTGEIIYEYGFLVNHLEVIEEYLLEKYSDDSGKVLFKRNKRELTLGKGLTKKNELKYSFNATRNNQLFLNSSVTMNLDIFRPVYEWFRDALRIIKPRSYFTSQHQLMGTKHSLNQNLNEVIHLFDTGVIGISNQKVPPQLVNSMFPKNWYAPEQLRESEMKILYSPIGRYLVEKKNGEISIKQMVFQHRNSVGEIVSLDLSLESDGTLRLVELLPEFFNLTSGVKSKVLVIDEIDSSLHTFLTKNLIKSYLGFCSKDTRCQLIYTTHDIQLMDSTILRNDEFWVFERDLDGVSHLHSFDDFNDIDVDENVQDLYLEGRLGGVPNILFESTEIERFLFNNEGKEYKSDELA